jgi:hypothetical protein
MSNQGGGSSRFDAEEIKKYMGYLAHFTIEEIRRDHLRPKWNATNNDIWSVDYCDKGEDSEILESSVLLRSSDNRKLRGKPDLVLVNRSESHAIVFERKTTNKSRDELLYGETDPSTWPNCWAQLWAYAHLDRYLGSKTITLVLQPWYWNENNYLTMGHTFDRQFQRDDQFDADNLELFKRYGGIRI